MNESEINPDEIKHVLSSAAKQELLPRFDKIQETKKSDGSILTEADLACQQYIESRLKQLNPEILFLAEEMSVEQQEQLIQQKDKPIWILDPLDGTTNFASGIPYYAISLALIADGEIQAGFVYDPERDEMFSAMKGKGASLQRGSGAAEKLQLDSDKTQLGDAVACIDLKRLPADLATRIVQQHPFRSQRSFGGVALDWCWLAVARFDIYLHGKQNIWDYAAGNLIYTEAGGHSCTLDGEPVFSHRLEARVGVAGVSKELFTAWTNWLAIKR